MFTLIALGTGAYSYSVFALLFPGMIPASFREMADDLAVYFEPAAVIVTLVLLVPMPVGMTSPRPRTCDARIFKEGFHNVLSHENDLLRVCCTYVVFDAGERPAARSLGRCHRQLG
jgi:hypothetical protein